MWEYKIKTYKFTYHSELLMLLNVEGGNGWEVIKYDEEKPDKFGQEFTTRIIYKRKLPA